MYNIIQGNADNFYKLPDNITFSRIIEEISKGILVINTRWEVIYASEKTEKFTGLKSAEITSKNILKLFPELKNTSLYTVAANVLKDKQNRKFNAYIPQLKFWLSGTVHYDHLGIVVVIHDLSHKKEFIESTFHEDNVVEHLNDPLFVIDLENRVRIWNQAAVYLFGWEKEEVLDQKIEDFISLRMEGYTSEEFKQLILSNGGWNGDTYQYDRYNSLRIIHLTASPIRGKGNAINGIAFLCKDITKKKQSEIDLLESHNLYKTAIDNVKEIIFKTDRNGILTYLNAAWEISTGYKIEESIGRNICDFKAGDINLTFLEMLENVTKDEKFDFTVKTASGQIREMLIYANKNIEGSRLIGVSGTIIDVTDSRVFEKELLRHVRILKSISYASTNFLKNKKWEEKIISVLAKIGFSTEVDSCFIAKFNGEGGNKKINVLYDWALSGFESEIPEHFEQLDKNLVLDIYSYLEEQILFCNHNNDICSKLNLNLGNVNIDSFLGMPIYVDDKLWGMVCFENFEKAKYWIETEIKALKTFAEMLGAAIARSCYEDNLIRSKEISEKANRLKSEFLAQISHEVRTPINALLSFSNFIGGEFRDKVDDDTRQSFSVIETAGKRIIRTIDLILHMSELQAGTYDFRAINLDVYEDVLNDIYLEHFHQAKKKGLSFSILPLTKDTIVLGDVFSISQIFTQLVNNAIKYTKDGGVSIKIFRNAADKLVVEIKDSGIGISDEYLPKLFELFSQEEQGYTRPYDGNGLGLALVNKYCELNNAIISVESEKNKGSIFRVTFN